MVVYGSGDSLFIALKKTALLNSGRVGDTQNVLHCASSGLSAKNGGEASLVAQDSRSLEARILSGALLCGA